MALLTEEEREIDPYDALGIDVSATEQEVKRAYRKKALTCHPDKHPGPEAAAVFHIISLSLAILTDPAKRNFIDTKLQQSRAAAARRAEMDAKRKAGVEDLMRREEEAKRARTEAAKYRRAAADEEAVRDAGRRMVEEARLRAMAAAAAKQTPAPPTQENATQRPKPPPIGPLDLTLTIQLPPNTSLGTEEALASALGRYGAVSDIVILPAKTKEGQKARGPRAVIEFASGNWGGCWACLRDNSRDHSGRGTPIEKGAKAKWAKGEPEWLAWAEKYASPSELTSATPVPPPGPAASTPPSAASAESRPAFGSTPFVSRDFSFVPSFPSAPDFGPMSSSARVTEETALKSAFESATLLRMRQKERERLEEQIRRQEEEEAA